jgi:hypothetical protein
LRASVEEVEVLRFRLRGAVQQFVAAIESKHYEFEESAGRVKPEATPARPPVQTPLQP